MKSRRKYNNERNIVWSNIIKISAKTLLVINIIGSILLYSELSNNEFVWIPIATFLNGIFSFPLMMGFSEIVAAAEKKLES